MILEVRPKKDEFLKKIYEESMNELDEFFQLNWKRNRPNVFLMEDRNTINAFRGGKAPDWVTGWVFGNNICVLSNKNFEKESSHKYSDKRYKGLIKHELAHSFTKVFAGFGGRPKWLWEGIAIYLSGQLKSKTTPEKLSNFLTFHEAGAMEGVYKESGFAVEFLVEKYGKEKLLSLLKLLREKDTPEQLAKKFREVYGFDLDYKNFPIK